MLADRPFRPGKIRTPTSATPPLLGAQAATAIANARTYQAEQRARADLEALVETGVGLPHARPG